MTFKFNSNDRGLVVGQTGSGKTVFCEWFLRDAKRLIVLDSKGNLKDRFNLVDYDRKSIRALAKNQPVRIQIKQPILDLNDLPEYYEKIFADMLEAGNLTIYIDETNRITGYSNRVLAYFGAAYTQGREVNKVGILASVQRPVNTPKVIITEAQHYWCFRLTTENDRKTMSEVMGGSPEVKGGVLHEHGFYYYNHQLSRPEYYAKLKT
jgi:hypothetical protein